jgi:hypothetical protein
MRRTALAAALLACAFSTAVIAHPHVVRKIQIPLRAGNLEVQYFTVPYNAETLKTAPQGFYFHLGFASVKLGAPVKTGERQVDSGSYHLFAHSVADGKWELVLIPEGSGRSIAMSGFEITRTKDEAKRKELLQRVESLAENKIALPTRFERSGATTEHLRVTVEDEGANYGEMQGPGQVGSKSLGHDFTLHVDFGDLHASVAFREPGEAAGDQESGSR